MSYLNELLERLVAIEVEALASIGVTADAKPYFYHIQGAFPYFTNRVVDIPISDDGSQDEDVNSPVIVARLVLAHATEGYKGEPEDRLYEWLPVIKTYINQRMWLQSAAFPNRMDNLQSARVVNNGGLRVFQNEGINATQIGAEIQIACILDEYIQQIYY